ncbi:nitrous oxide reductase accessory protein NosL [Paenibacillus tuaregi]|uniref:nitrous oxide reductase accessory protein NosL n=1 Tax=Paenibacillus tuaregi TaxID=1816681 RepID=UPI000838DA0C|nr:nitrous oxide reductase accessory protein NosL [Paenibacillus tuaregi]
MNKKLWSAVFLPLLLLGMICISACGKTYEALPIDEKVDICAICNMQVKDDAFATQLTTKDGKTYKFDDIGCMHKWKEQNGTGNIGMDFVRDYNDKAWIEYSKAYFVYDSSIRTPMAYGILSFKDKTSAEAFVAEQGIGKVLTAEELNQHNWKQSKAMDNMDHMKEHTAEEGDNKQHSDMKDSGGHK